MFKKLQFWVGQTRSLDLPETDSHPIITAHGLFQTFCPFLCFTYSLTAAKSGLGQSFYHPPSSLYLRPHHSNCPTGSPQTLSVSAHHSLRPATCSCIVKCWERTLADWGVVFCIWSPHSRFIQRPWVQGDRDFSHLFCFFVARATLFLVPVLEHSVSGGSATRWRWSVKTFWFMEGHEDYQITLTWDTTELSWSGWQN